MRSAVLLASLLALMPSLLQAQAGDGRVYVRRIEFLGTDRIADNVLRREVSQLESTHINTVALEQSRLRLQRLPYVERAEMAQRPVKDAPDQVDILITITEAPAREYGVGGGYSESKRVSGYGYFVNENLLGTGQRLFARAEVSEFHTAAELSHTNHFVGSNRINQTIALSSRRFNQLTADTTDLDGDLARAQLQYGYRVAERQALRLGLALQNSELRTGLLTSSQLEHWVRSNGNPTVRDDGASTDFLSGEFLLGWHYDTRDKIIFPDAGAEQLFGSKVAVPGSDIEYYAIDYRLDKYWALGAGWTAHVGARLGFGARYGSKTTSLPPNANWFAGGPDSVRGYRENRLGPKDSLGNPYGGNLFLASRFELFVPVPEKWQESARIGLFYDIGNVFSTEDVGFQDDAGLDLDYGFDFSELRQSVGVSGQFVVPIGVLRLSYGIPLNARDKNPNRFRRDDIERFQIAIGVEF